MMFVHCLGDCFTEGIGSAPGEDYPAHLQRMLGKNYAVINYGITMLKLEDAVKYSYASRRVYHPGYACVWLGTNDLSVPKSIISPQKLFYLMAELCDVLRERNNKIIIFTITHWGDVNKTNYEKRRQEYNAMIREGYKTIADYLVDLGDHPHLGIENATAYFSQDGNHPDGAGYELIARMVAEIIRHENIAEGDLQRPTGNDIQNIPVG